MTPLLTGLLVGCGDSNEVGRVSLGLFTTQDIKIEKVNDPVVTDVIFHISQIKADFSFSDPSDMGISCRQTGPVTMNMLDAIDKSTSGELVFKSSKNILFKSLKIRRIWDADNKTLIYLSYSTKEVDGSHKHSISTVPMWGNQVWEELNTQMQK